MAVTLEPTSREELCRMLAESGDFSSKIERVEMRHIAALIEHFPEDMTATVEAGMTLGSFQQQLRKRGQWLPIDPPNSDQLTIGDLLAWDYSGPRRLGYGVIRDYLIGIKVALADGRLIKAGGKVVKNVAGYDLCKLFVGAQHSLGIIVEATFKLRPVPEKESFVRATPRSLEELADLRAALLDSAAEPIVFDAHNLDGSLNAIAAFAGYREDVEVQLEIARKLGFTCTDEPGYLTQLWLQGAPNKVSVLPSKTIEAVSAIQPRQFVAHLGNGIIFYRGENSFARPALPLGLMHRLKQTYDPKQILPQYNA